MSKVGAILAFLNMIVLKSIHSIWSDMYPLSAGHGTHRALFGGIVSDAISSFFFTTPTREEKSGNTGRSHCTLYLASLHQNRHGIAVIERVIVVGDEWREANPAR